MTTRRGFLLGAVGFLAAPAIVRATSIMPVKATPPVAPSCMWVADEHSYWVGERGGLFHYRRGSWTDVIDAWNHNRGILSECAKAS